MSPLFPETLHVFYGPEAVHAVSRCGLQRRPGEARRYAVPAAGRDGWRDGLAALAAALEDGRCRCLRVVLSNHFVHYRLLPWRNDLETTEEYLALARLEFAEAFGGLAGEWTIALSDERPGATRVAAAVPTGLLEGIDAAAAAAGCRLASVQPYLTVAVNAWRSRLPRDEGRWLLVHEPGRLCFALIEGGRWQWLRHQRVGAGWHERLPDLLEEEELLAGADDTPATVLMFAPSASRSWPPAAEPDIEFVGLPGQCGFTAEGDGAFAAAWIG